MPQLHLGGSQFFRLRLVTLAVASCLAACGGTTDASDAGMDAGPPDVGTDAFVRAPDAGPPDAGPPPDGGPVCGDGEVEGREACDDGNRRPDDGCSAACALECGDGRVSGDELCDPGIASGEGACPVSCDDGMVCTTDTRIGAGCSTECAATEITLPADGDGCCPPDASSLVDPDCAVVCGNGLVEVGELCDTGLTMGLGGCPTACDDGAVCTSDVLVDPGTCTARCLSTEVTAPADGDGCCPAGATVERATAPGPRARPWRGTRATRQGMTPIARRGRGRCLLRARPRGSPVER